MGNRDSSIQALAKKLGKDYRVTVIDLEPVIYRDFGNGFNVEISGMYTTIKRKRQQSIFGTEISSRIALSLRPYMMFAAKTSAPLLMSFMISARI